MSTAVGTFHVRRTNDGYFVHYQGPDADTSGRHHADRLAEVVLLRTHLLRLGYAEVN